SRVRLDRAHGAGPIARGRSCAGGVPAGPSRAALFSRRGAALDLDLSDRRQRVPAGSRADGENRTARRGAQRRRAGRGRSAVHRSRGSRSARESDREAARQLPAARRRALPARRAVRRTGGGAATAARNGEDAVVSRQAAAAAAAGDRLTVKRFWVRGSRFGVRLRFGGSGVRGSLNRRTRNRERTSNLEPRTRNRQRETYVLRRS